MGDSILSDSGLFLCVYSVFLLIPVSIKKRGKKDGWSGVRLDWGWCVVLGYPGFWGVTPRGDVVWDLI